VIGSISRICKEPKTLLWLIPIIYGSFVFIMIITRLGDPDYWPDRRLFFVFVTPAWVISPIGAYWALYQCIRFERKPWRYIPFLFIPFGFLWYYLERYLQVHRPRVFRGRN
jgi:hypothetical protein